MGSAPMTKHFIDPRITVREKVAQGYTHAIRGKYGRGELRLAAAGPGYVIDWVPSDWCRRSYGKGPRVIECKAYHTAIATLHALTHG